MEVQAPEFSLVQPQLMQVFDREPAEETKDRHSFSLSLSLSPVIFPLKANYFSLLKATHFIHILNIYPEVVIHYF